MYTTRKSPASRYSFGASDIGQRAYVRLVSGFRNHRLIIRLRATATLAGGPATALRNSGSVAALFDAIGLEDNGEDIVRISGAEARLLSQWVAPAPLSAARITGYANGAYTIEEDIVIPFAWPLGVSPTESCFVERDPRNALQAFFVYNGVGANLATTAGTVTLTNVSASVIQEYDTERLKPLYVPRIRSIIEPIDGTVQDYPVYIKTDKLLRGILVGGYATTVGVVEDIISAIALRSDDREILGPAQADWEDAVRMAEFEIAGKITDYGYDASAAATQPNGNFFFPYNFQQSGRLSNVLNPNLDRNLRVVVDAAPTAVAGAGSSLIRCTLLELMQIPGVTADAPPFNV